MISKASSYAATVDNIFLFIMGISVVLLVAITFLMVYFVIKYRRSKNIPPANIEGHTGLEVAWTVIPTILVIAMFYYGWVGFKEMRTVPKGAMKVTVTARMWSWLYEYENGKKTDVLKVPVGKPVKLELRSLDVLHSFYVAAFRIKEDVVPGMENYLWFKPTEVGTYDVQCAEYCGLRHSYMLSKVEVMPEEDFQQWYAADGMMAKAGAAEPALAAEELLGVKGCLACHTTDGKPLVGPTFKGMFGKKEKVQTEGKEREIVVDEAHIRKSLIEPQSDIVVGFPPIMPTQEGLVSEEEIRQIIAYLKELK
jgi:cytochrome c oxidase subunit 2